MKRFNKSQFIWLIILMCFTLYFLYLIKTGKINTYLHPRMVKYTVISVCGFIILMIRQLGKIFTISRNNKFKLGYIVFFLPLILGFTTKGFDSSIADSKGIKLNTINNDTNVTQSNKESNTAEDFQKWLDEMRKDYFEDGVVVFKESTYYGLLDDISADLAFYKGKKVQITGFVFKDKKFAKNQFVIARLAMSCCAADAQVLGLMAQWDNAEELGKSEWVKVEGRIESTIFKESDSDEGYEMPLIVIESIERNQEPLNEYIYPN